MTILLTCSWIASASFLSVARFIWYLFLNLVMSRVASCSRLACLLESVLDSFWLFFYCLGYIFLIKFENLSLSLFNETVNELVQLERLTLDPAVVFRLTFFIHESLTDLFNNLILKVALSRRI